MLASSPLAIGVSAAIVLTLAFRLGTRHSADIVWTDAADSMAQAIDFLKRKAREWKVDTETMERGAAAAERVLAHIGGKLHPDAEQGRLRTSYDGIHLMLDISYRGEAIPVAALATPHRAVPDASLDDEEAPMTIGLQTFIRGLNADRRHVRASKERVRVRLWYAA